MRVGSEHATGWQVMQRGCCSFGPDWPQPKGWASPGRRPKSVRAGRPCVSVSRVPCSGRSTRSTRRRNSGAPSCVTRRATASSSSAGVVLSEAGGSFGTVTATHSPVPPRWPLLSPCASTPRSRLPLRPLPRKSRGLRGALRGPALDAAGLGWWPRAKLIRAPCHRRAPGQSSVSRRVWVGSREVFVGGRSGPSANWAVLERSVPAPSAPTVQHAAAPTPSVTPSVRPPARVHEAARPSPDAHPSAAAAPRVRSRRMGNSVPQGEQRLAEEVRLLAEADRALRVRNTAEAEKVLAELEQKVPHGKLDEERTAVGLITKCLQDPGVQARAEARAFLLRHSSTVYAGRIRESCQLAGRGRDGSK
jgi:hypothetical protein